MLRISYILIFLCSFISVVTAQDKPYVFQDSTIMVPKTPEEIAIDTAFVPINKSDIGSSTDRYDSIGDTSVYFNQLKISPDSIQHWKNQKGFEYAKYLDSLLMNKQNAKMEKLSEDVSTGPGWLDRLLSSQGTKVFFWILAGLFILFIVYRLFLTETIFRKKPAAQSPLSPDLDSKELNSETDFDHNISHALQNGNYRLAIRYHYLKALYHLADKHLIELAADKTNFQYVREMTHRPYQNDFAYITLSYEYVWYGEFNIDENVYAMIAPRFSGFNQKIMNGN